MAYGGGEIVGVDPATESGIARGVPGAVPILRIIDFRVLKTDTKETIFKQALFEIATYFSKRPPEAMFIEEPLLKRQRGADLAPVIYGIWVAVAANRGVNVYKLQPHEWRAAFFGKGNGFLKRHIAKAKAKEACRILGWDCLNNDNAAESGGIWTYGVRELAGEKKLPPLHRLQPLFAGKDAA